MTTEHVARTITDTGNLPDPAGMPNYYGNGAWSATEAMPKNQYGAATEEHIADILAGRARTPTDCQSIARVRANATPHEQSQLRYLLATVLSAAEAEHLFAEAGRSMPLYQP